MSLNEFRELTMALANLALFISIIVVTVYFVLNIKKLRADSSTKKSSKKVTRSGNDL